MELQLWREMLTPYELAVDELVLKFRHIIRWAVHGGPTARFPRIR